MCKIAKEMKEEIPITEDNFFLINRSVDNDLHLAHGKYGFNIYLQLKRSEHVFLKHVF